MIRKAGCKLSGKKCQFAKRSLRFLDHVIDSTGVKRLPEKLDIIRSWETPKTEEEELCRFLGVCTFWRKFVKDAVTCDALDYAVGYYLEQADKSGQRRPVAFGGRKLHKAELNYSTTEKECLAVAESLKSYRSYLLGNQFDLYTDHQSLKWLLTRTKEHSDRLWRWVDKIREFQFLVKHIPGWNNTVADTLSRIRNVATQEPAQWNLEYIQQQKKPVQR